MRNLELTTKTKFDIIQGRIVNALKNGCNHYGSLFLVAKNAARDNDFTATEDLVKLAISAAKTEVTS